MNTINTKYGSFEIANNEGHAAIFIGDKKICEFPKTPWWDIDGIEKGIEMHHELIEKRVKERPVVEVTRENAAEVMGQLIGLFGNEEKGFYASRLKQCLNKFLAA